MKRHVIAILLLLSLLLTFVPLLAGCSLVSVVPGTDDEADETDPPATKTTEKTTATPTTATTTTENTTATTADQTDPPDPPKKTVPDDPYTPTLYVPTYDAAYEDKIEEGITELHVTQIVDAPSRTGLTYPRRLPLSASSGTANTREELIEIANWHAFYREGEFTVTLGYPVDDVEVELTHLYRYSCFIPSICSLSGSLAGNALTVRLKFYPESYLVTPRETVEREVLGGENAAPTGLDSLPGLDYAHGVSVWDSEQACYALSQGYAVSPIAGSPAETLIDAARIVLAGIVDDSMSEWQIAYRVYHWLMNHSEYDYKGDAWSSFSFDKANESEMLPARVISFYAEGPLLYGVGVCFGYAKAAELLLGLEGLELRRVVAFHWKITAYDTGRNWNILYDYGYGSEINVHSYLYLHIGDNDYIFDPSYSKNGQKSVQNSSNEIVKVLALKDYVIGLSKQEHGAYCYTEFPSDPFSESAAYKPGTYRYLSEITYDGTHSLLLSSTEDAQRYYTYLLNNVFNGAPAYRTVTLFFSNWNWTYQDPLDEFLYQACANGGRYTVTSATSAGAQTGASTMVTIVFTE